MSRWHAPITRPHEERGLSSRRGRSTNRSAACSGRPTASRALGNIALARSDHETAREAYEQALTLYLEVKEPYSVGRASLSLARLVEEGAECCRYVSDARAAWSSIKREDLVAELAEEFPDCD